MAVSINGAALNGREDEAVKHTTGSYASGSLVRYAEKKYGEDIQRNMTRNSQKEPFTFRDKLYQAADKNAVKADTAVNSGASIEEHLGQRVPTKQKSGQNEKADDGKSWWDLRMERFAEYMAEQKEIALARRQAAGIRAMEIHKQALFERRWENADLAEPYQEGNVPDVQELLAQIPFTSRLRSV